MEDTISVPARKSARQDNAAPPIDGRLAAAHAHFHAGRHRKAETLAQQFLRRNAGDPGALHLLGLIARAKGRLDRAVQLLSKAAAGAPDAAHILCDLGNASKAAGRFDDAIRTLARVTELLPASPEAQSNLGAAYNAAGRAEEAVACFERALSSRPGNAEFLFNLGNGLLAAGRLEEAETALGRAADADPRHLRALTNLGVARKELGRLDQAVDTFGNVIRLDPNCADAHWNLSLALIMAGHYRDGWREYEWRRRIPGFAMRNIEGPQWDGKAYAGKTLLIHAEQGLGDSIQFARYLPMAADSAGKLVFVCQQPVKALFEGLGGFDGDFELRGSDERLPRFDMQAPLLSLPHLLDVPEPVWPVAGPYLRAQPERTARWRQRLGGADKFKVGICWQGRPDYKADRRRSVPLEEFAALAAMDGVHLVSLQKGHGAEQLEHRSWRDAVLQPGPEMDFDGAFLDSAAIVGALDLVITSDTAMAHLAGALGATTWLMLAHMPDWRWGTEGAGTPWYPATRLFRQRRPGDWAGVMAEITKQLGTLKNA